MLAATARDHDRGNLLTGLSQLAAANRTGNRSHQMQEIFGTLRVDPITGFLIATRNINLRKTMAYQPLYAAVATPRPSIRSYNQDIKKRNKKYIPNA